MKRLRDILIFLTAFWLLFSCSEDKGQMLRQLEMLEEANRADSVMNNDSLAEDLVTYFDKHGTPNERMRARYILGRTYYDMGEQPRALETYLEAADCADTTASDCDYKVLSRIHAQSAEIYHQQIQPRSQITELSKAMIFARRANDALMAIECYSKTADAYDYLKMPDSVIVVVKEASNQFKKIQRNDRAAQILSIAITPLVEKNQLNEAKGFIDTYESQSGFFDGKGNIKEGRKIYYYIKGVYYLAAHQIDSAEMMFRKELKEASTINHLIAGNKGLQEVFGIRGISDSVAKYANFGYELNDSAYSLSEMQNVQRLKASYDYSHNKLIAEQKTQETERTRSKLYLTIMLIIVIVAISFFVFLRYKRENEQKILAYQKDLNDLEKIQSELMDLCSEDKLSPEEFFEKKSQEIKDILNRVTSYKLKSPRSDIGLEERLNTSVIVMHLRELANATPYKKASKEDFKKLRNLINEEIPHFYTALNTTSYTLTPLEYEVSLLIRVHFSPSDICKLEDISKSYVSNMRSRLLLRVYKIDGSPKDYDQRIMTII